MMNADESDDVAVGEESDDFGAFIIDEEQLEAVEYLWNCLVL